MRRDALEREIRESESESERESERERERERERGGGVLLEMSSKAS
jgi:hypothetical protein